MDNNNQAPNNVIQFPSAKKKETEDKSSAPQAPAPKVNTAVAPKSPKGKNLNAKMAGTVVAIILATGAVNRFTFDKKAQSADLSSNSRSIASVGHTEWQRDAAWEKNLAESLAAADQDRGVASTGLGHAATAEERLKWGTLEEKYTIVYKSEAHNIQTIVLQDPTTSPAYILDRNKFLNEYGRLLENQYASSKLKSVEVSHDKTVESYTLFDKDQRPKSEAHFELDTHKRLLSLRVDDVKI